MLFLFNVDLFQTLNKSWLKHCGALKGEVCGCLCVCMCVRAQSVYEETVREKMKGRLFPIWQAESQLILTLVFCAITYMSGIEGSLCCSHMPAGPQPVESDLSLRKHYQLQMQPGLPE